MSDDVTIPRAMAQRAAKILRRVGVAYPLSAMGAEELADLLDPPKPSLRDEVARAWCAEFYGEYSGSALAPASDQLDAAGAVLAVVKARIDALPKIGQGDGYGQSFGYRVRDVEALFSGVTPHSATPRPPSLPPSRSSGRTSACAWCVP